MYADIARVEKYASCGKTYADLADISLLVSEPEMFTEFWQSCVVSGVEVDKHLALHWTRAVTSVQYLSRCYILDEYALLMWLCVTDKLQ